MLLSKISNNKHNTYLGYIVYLGYTLYFYRQDRPPDDDKQNKCLFASFNSGAHGARVGCAGKARPRWDAAQVEPGSGSKPGL